MFQTLFWEKRSPSSGLTPPKRPVRLSRGKKSALATPTFALAAIRSCSACRTSGRRSRSVDGRPGGTSGGTAMIGPSRGIGCGFRPSRKLIWFSRATIARSISGISAATCPSDASARDVSRAEAAPPSSRRLKRSYVSWKAAVVRVAISRSSSSSRSSM
jgi:hypothetical protein